MRLPLFNFRAPRTVDETARILDGEGSSAMLLAGGTDLIPNMKRRQQVPRTLVSIRHVEGLNILELGHVTTRLGSCITLTEIARDRRFGIECSALWQAASAVATPHIRNMATLGGNICLDTRCLYYDQNYEWRKAINFCMKKEGDTCWVAPGSDRCMAVSSTDTAPALIALGAHVRLRSRSEERDVALIDLYNDDGMSYLTRKPNEILTEIRLGGLEGWKSTYWKLRRRGSFDFPVLSVAAAARSDGGGVIQEARIVLGAVASRPLLADEAAKALLGRKLDQDAIAEAAALASRIAKPLSNTDFDMSWRKKVTSEFVTYALRELRGDDMSSECRQLSGHN
ncbi:MAG TPA: FAD binding domain-containing protein [Candidatus Dormibacteraeota bacterium]|nr:FAD binding domain-containing protein [Candidatus Dormibacteraeota bacterium]